MKNEMYAEIRKWHQEYNSTSLKKALELGDLMLKVCRATGQGNWQIAEDIVKDMGNEALSTNYYCMAFKLSNKFSDKHREVIINAGMSLRRALILASEKYDAQRVKIINKIKSGRMKAPFSNLEYNKKPRNPQMNMDVDYDKVDAAANPNNVIVRLVDDDGNIDLERCLDLLANVLSKVANALDKAKAETLVERAKRKAGL